MKTTISLSLISLVSAGMLALGACSGVGASKLTGPTDPSRCPAPDSAAAQGQFTACPR